MARFFCRCRRCKATCWATGHYDTQGDEMMIGSISVIDDFKEWEGGQADCPHDAHAEIISETDPDYD